VGLKLGLVVGVLVGRGDGRSVGDLIEVTSLASKRPSKRGYTLERIFYPPAEVPISQAELQLQQSVESRRLTKSLFIYIFHTV